MKPDAGELQSWWPLVVLSSGFVAIVVALGFAGFRQSRAGGWLAWVPRGLQRATGIPGWAAGMVGTALFGLLLAGIGFYNDVAWHIGLGRDEELFTAPHTMIVIGLQLFVVAGAVGIVFATVERWPGGLRWGSLHVPRSAVAMIVVGTAAVSGFPLDELWHRQFGIDVTMWSPTHLVMIVGASITPVVSWLALAEAGVRPGDSWRTRVVALLAAMLLLDGLSSVQGEFDFGVPQFQALYAPVLVVFAGALAFAAIRIAHGPGWSLLVAGLFTATRFDLGSGTGALDVDVRPAALYVGSAVAVELAAWLVGTEGRARFALAAGVGVATLGLAGEWWWNQGAHQPWTGALLPDALLIGLVVAVGAAVVGGALGDVARLRPPAVGGRALALAGLAVLLALAWPLPRRTGDVTATIAFDRVGDGRAVVEATVSPPDAADDARWFQVTAWQGGGLVLADMEEVEPGVWRSAEPAPIEAPWKTLLRLHRGAEMMAIPLFLPADAEIEGERGEAVAAVDRVAPFERESLYLLREQTGGGSALFGWGIPALVLGLGAAAVGSFVWVGRSVGRSGDLEHPLERHARPAGGLAVHRDPVDRVARHDPLEAPGEVRGVDPEHGGARAHERVE